jgi:hypothetical protein
VIKVMMKINNLEPREICDIFSPAGRNFMTLYFDKSYEMISEDINKGIITLILEIVKIEELDLPIKRGRESKLHRLLKANAKKLLRARV